METDAEGLVGLARGLAPDGLALPPGGVAPREALEGLAAAAEGGARTWLVVEGGEVVGLCGTKSAPRGGTVEIGYGTAPARRRRGHARAALAALLRELAAGGIERVAAETEAGNAASERVLAASGFQRGGRRVAVEGALTLWWQPLGLPPAAIRAKIGRGGDTAPEGGHR